MSEDWVDVRVHWRDGSRAVPYTGGRLSAPTRAVGLPEHADTPLWTFILEFPEPAKGTGSDDARGRYLAPNAPREELLSGKRLELFEGAVPIAEIEVLK